MGNESQTYPQNDLVFNKEDNLMRVYVEMKFADLQ